MFAVQGNSHGGLEPCCFLWERGNRAYAETVERCSPQARVSWRSSNRDEFRQWELCWANRTHMTTHRAKGALPLNLFRCSSFKTNWRSHSFSSRHRRTVCVSAVKLFFFHHSPFFCFFSLIAYFSSNGCLTCHVWFEEKVVRFGCRASWGFHMSVSKSILTSSWTPVSSSPQVLCKKKEKTSPNSSPLLPVPLLSDNDDISIFQLEVFSFILPFKFPKSNI